MRNLTQAFETLRACKAALRAVRRLQEHPEDAEAHQNVMWHQGRLNRLNDEAAEK